MPLFVTYVHAQVIARNRTNNHDASARITNSVFDALAYAFLWDDRLSGFFVKVTLAGRKVYAFNYRMGGRGAKVRRYTIRRNSAILAEGARSEASQLFLLVAQGTDPLDEKTERHRQTL